MKIAPSILAADFARLGEQVAAAEAAGAEQIHVDVMDGHFVPNISIGPVVVEAVRRITRLPLDVHLMISEPDRYVAAFAQAGASALTVHVEASDDILHSLRLIRTAGMRAGVALRPGTPLAGLHETRLAADIWLIMSVEPGFGGQAFIPDSIGRIAQARQILDEAKSDVDLAVDGGVDAANAKNVCAAGATVLVAGSAIFRDKLGIDAAIKALRAAATAP